MSEKKGRREEECGCSNFKMKNEVINDIKRIDNEEIEEIEGKIRIMKREKRIEKERFN